VHIRISSCRQIGHLRFGILSLCTLTPFTDKELNVLWYCAKTSLPFLFTFYILLGMQKPSASEQLAPLIILRPKQNIESELKWQTC